MDMDGNRFDRIARVLAYRHLSRRDAVRDGGATAVAAVASGGLGRVSAQPATPAAQDATASASSTGFGQEFLFVQTAASGTLVPNPAAGTPTAEGTPTPGAGADYLLTLAGHPGQTVYFSDRPARVFGDAPTQRFFDGLGFPPDDPPNAALVAQTDAGDDVVVVELFAPTYDEGTGRVTYGVNILSDYAVEGLAHAAAQDTIAELPADFVRASLFIDDCTSPKQVYCYSAPSGLDSGSLVGNLGSYPFCWHFGDLCCWPCESDSEDYWNTQCNQMFSAQACDGECHAHSDGCW